MEDPRTDDGAPGARQAEDVVGIAADGSSTRTLGMMFKRQIGVQDASTLATPDVEKILSVNVMAEGPEDGLSTMSLSGRGNLLSLETINTAMQTRAAELAFVKKDEDGAVLDSTSVSNIDGGIQVTGAGGFQMMAMADLRSEDSGLMGFDAYEESFNELPGSARLEVMPNGSVDWTLSAPDPSALGLNSTELESNTDDIGATSSSRVTLALGDSMLSMNHVLRGDRFSFEFSNNTEPFIKVMDDEMTIYPELHIGSYTVNGTAQVYRDTSFRVGALKIRYSAGSLHSAGSVQIDPGDTHSLLTPGDDVVLRSGASMDMNGGQVVIMSGDSNATWVPYDAHAQRGGAVIEAEDFLDGMYPGSGEVIVSSADSQVMTGNVTVSSGSSATSTTGNVRIASGDATSEDDAGLAGDVLIESGTGFAQGSSVRLSAGDITSNITSPESAFANLTDPGSAGMVQVSAGNSLGPSGTGGRIELTAGAGADYGGDVSIKGGVAFGEDGLFGGNVAITSGGHRHGDAGDVMVRTANAGGSGAAGQLALVSGQSEGKADNPGGGDISIVAGPTIGSYGSRVHIYAGISAYNKDQVRRPVPRRYRPHDARGGGPGASGPDDGGLSASRSPCPSPSRSRSRSSSSSPSSRVRPSVSVGRSVWLVVVAILSLPSSLSLSSTTTTTTSSALCSLPLCSLPPSLPPSLLPPSLTLTHS